MLLEKVQNAYLFKNKKTELDNETLKLECSNCHKFYQGYKDSLLCKDCTQSTLRSPNPLKASIFDILKSKSNEAPEALKGA